MPFGLGFDLNLKPNPSGLSFGTGKRPQDKKT